MTKIQETGEKVVANVERVIVGKHHEVRLALVALMCRGHLLIEDVPGTGKTVLAKALARSLDCTFRRIQFTPDLLPSDVTGLSIYNQKTQEFEFRPGPIMAQVVLADEINRATPKTQSSLLECMEEHQATIDGTTYPMPDPFLVIATQNPIEYEGTFALPEAQLDRFMFKILVDYPNFDDELAIAETTTGGDLPTLDPLLDRAEILNLQKTVRKVLVGHSVAAYAVKLARATRPNTPEAPDFVNKYLTWGCGTRACQALLLGAKAQALLDGRVHVSTEDIRSVARPVMRHRLVTSFSAESDGITPDHIVEKLFEAVREPLE